MIADLIKTTEWAEIKGLIYDSLKDDVSTIKTDGKTPEVIALEVIGMKKANEKIRKAIIKVERQAKLEKIKSGSFK
jgi:guanylate kinase